MRTFGNHSSGPALGSLREIVFGMEDGIVSTAGAVIGIAAGTRDPKVAVFSGIVIIIVEALSMAAGSYLSEKSQRQLLEQKIREEKKEIEEHPEKEALELETMYRARGFNNEETALLVKRITSDKKLWLEEMMAKELRIGAGELDNTESGALYMWLAYSIGGLIPVLPFVFFDVTVAIAVAFVLSLAGLFALGYWKAKVSGTNPLRSGLEMLMVSAAAGTLGFIVGSVVGPLLGVDVQM